MCIVTNLMLRKYQIQKLGYDFMGFSLQRGDKYSFHHLIVPAREHGPREVWNGAILCRNTSHDYIHRIESVDYDAFSYITSEMIDMNMKGYLDITNLRRIHELLLSFEREYSDLRTKNGKYLIKDEYRRRNKF